MRFDHRFHFSVSACVWDKTGDSAGVVEFEPPALIAQLEWLETMLDIGCHFSTSADSLITECHVRTRLALATYEAAVLAEAKPDEINTKLNSFLELFIREKDIVRHTETFKATEHGHELEVYQTRISTNLVVQRNQS